MWILLMLLAVPIIEIALFIEVGGLIGLWPTLALVLLAAVAGSAVMRSQGLQALGRLRTTLASGGDPVGPIANGALLLIAGMLLVIPGFFTDLLGILLLIPAVRAQVIRTAAGRMTLRAEIFARSARQARAGSREAIDADYEVLDDVPPGRRGASGWTRPQD